MEYLLKASVVIAIFYVCYKLFLQGETFFESNRWFLLLGIIIAFILPFIVIPIYITVESSPLENLIINSGNTTIGIAEKPFDILQLLAIIYLSGAGIFLCKVLLQFGSLRFLLFSNNKQKQGRYTFLITNSNTSPFSFFKWIIYNPTQFNEDELQQIISHEKVHARQYHSIDIILTQISSIIFWFNPFVWLYKKALQQNLEFIADQNTQKQFDCKKSYQHLLLKTSVPQYKMAIANNFYNSLIKKRIVMLHKNRSKNRNLWKFALILPLLALFIMSFNTKEIIINKSSDLINNAISETQESFGEIIEVIISKDSKEADLKLIKSDFKKAGITLKFSGIKRNGKDEIIAIKIDVRSKSSNANYNTDSDKPIKPIKISFDSEENNISIGNASELHFGKSKDYSFFSKDGKHKIHKSGKGSNVFVYSSSDDEHDGEHEVIEDEDRIIIKSGVKIHEIKKVHKDKNVFVISGDDGEVIELKGKEHKDGNVKIWRGDDDNVYELKTKVKKGNNKIFISKSGDKQPLFILDGKEITTENMDDIDPNDIESISVLKGDAAIKKYGEKGKNGVVIITTKKKE
jgi:bla regulator protein blaR1